MLRYHVVECIQTSPVLGIQRHMTCNDQQIRQTCHTRLRNGLVPSLMMMMIMMIMMMIMMMMMMMMIIIIIIIQRHRDGSV